MDLPADLTEILESRGTVQRVNLERMNSASRTPTPTRRNPARTATGKRNKFRNFRVYQTPDGKIVGEDFPGEKVKVADSRKEFARRAQLFAELAAGRIQAILPRKTFVLHGLDGSVICRYVPDFIYVKAGRRIVEDVKPMRKVKKNGEWLRHPNGDFVFKPFATPAYFLKKRMMKAEYGIEIQEF